MTNPSPIIYRAETGAIELRQDLKQETFWASQKQISQLFGVTPQNITTHIKGIFEEGELTESSTCKESLQVQIEGNRTIKRKVKEYNLDAIISVGYRINSKTATKFRQWATQILHSHIVEGFTINPSRIKHNHDNFFSAVNNIKRLLPTNSNIPPDEILDLVSVFAHTWLSLDAYDKSTLPQSGATKETIQFTAEELQIALADLKKILIKEKQATELFAQEKNTGTLQGIVGSIFQSAFKQDAYLTIEEKAAHLLYFIIKNHPFNDGNKRSGAFAFVWFLQKARILKPHQMSPEALTALTLLIAESNPKDKERMVGLVLLLLRN